MTPISSDYDPDFQKTSKYQKGVDYEQLLLRQMDRIAQFSSDKRLELYEASVDTLINMFPLSLQKRALEFKSQQGITFGISLEKKESYDRLWRFCNELLQEANLIYRTSYIRTYE